jgi:hypothetical protein
MAGGDPTRACALLLAAAALRAVFAGTPVPQADLLDPRTGPPTRLPDLARDGAAPLSWLPGLGVGRAHAVIAARPFVPGRLDAERLAEVPGVGEDTASAVHHALAEWRGAARLEWSDEERGAGP